MFSRERAESLRILGPKDTGPSGFGCPCLKRFVWLGVFLWCLCPLAFLVVVCVCCLFLGWC